jgi:hypothetical protein
VNALLLVVVVVVVVVVLGLSIKAISIAAMLAPRRISASSEKNKQRGEHWQQM